MANGPVGALSGYERQVVDCTARGVFADLTVSTGNKPPVRALLLRALLLGEPIPGGPAAVEARQGVRIRGARIEGKLDLADCARPGTGLPTLVLEGCDIPEPIDLGAARLARLSLAGSRFGAVNLREAEIDGPFDFSDASGFDDHACWIDGRGALINGDVIGTRAMLRVPLPPRDPATLADGDRRYALWLTGATIHGSLWLVDGFAADGGISLDASRMTGDVRISYGLVASEEGDAFRAQNANIGGIVLISHFVADGIVWLLGLRTGGAMQIRYAWIDGKPPSGGERRPAVGKSALILADADIGASALLSPGVTVHGRVSLTTAKIRGDFDATGIQVDNQTSNGRARAVELTNAEIGASLVLDKAVVQGRFDMAGARIGGKLSWLGVSLSNLSKDSKGQPDGRGQALEAMNVTVGGNVEFGRDNPYEQPVPTTVKGTLNLTGARIGGDLAFTGASIENLRSDGEGVAIVARQIDVKASILLKQFSARGALILTGATVGRDLLCSEATLYNPGRSALYAKDIEIGDDLRLLDSDVAGNLRFERAVVTGSVHWHDLKMRLDGQTGGPPYRLVRLELTHARIGSRLKCEGIDFECPCHVDLRGMRVATIDLRAARGLGKPHCAGGYCPVGLDGLVYERIELPDPDTVGAEPDADKQQREEASRTLRMRSNIPVDCWSRWKLPRRDQRVDLLLDWVLRDSLNDTVRPEGKHQVSMGGLGHRRNPQRSFNPQPFRQLTRALRAQGYETEARDIAIYEQWATPPANQASHLLYRLYGALFGFGLWPRRAVCTLFGYVLAGWLFAAVAVEDNLLVETPQITATAYSVDDVTQATRRAFVLAKGAQEPKREVGCSDITNPLWDALVYAADTVLPFIPLHQETKCELDPELHFLRFARACYTVIGWIVTSLALLTFSGIVRRLDGDPR